MEVLKLIFANWSQTVVLLTAIGALLKIILDFNIKKKEIKFEYVYKQKADAFKEYLLSYQNLKDKVIKQSYSFIYGNISFQEYELNIKLSIEELKSKIDLLYMFCSFKEKEQLYNIMNNSTFIIYEVKKVDRQNLNQVLDNYIKKTSNTLDNFINDFVK